jgi:hypothetical protein
MEKYITHCLKILCIVSLLLIIFGKSIHERLARPSKSYSRLNEEEDDEEQLD